MARFFPSLCRAAGLPSDGGCWRSSLAAFGREPLGSFLFLLVLVQVFFIPFPGPTAVSETAFYLSAALFAYGLARGRLRLTGLGRPLIVPLFVFFLWGLVSLCGALNPSNSIHDLYAHWLKYLFFFILTVNLVRSEGEITAVLAAVVISTVLYSLWEVIQYYVVMGNPLWKKLNYALPKEIPPNVTAVITVFGFLVGLHLAATFEDLRLKWAVYAGCLVMLATTLLTQSRSGVLALLTGLIVLFGRSKKALLAVVLVVTIAYLAVPARFSPAGIMEKLKWDDRVQIWLAYLEIIKDHPVKGVGFGMQSLYNDEFLKVYNERVPARYRAENVYYAPHNIFVDTATRTGVVGLGIFIWFLCYVFYLNARRLGGEKGPAAGRGARALSAALAALLIQGCFENTAHGPPLAILFVIAALTVSVGNLQDVEGTTLVKGLKFC